MPSSTVAGSTGTLNYNSSDAAPYAAAAANAINAGVANGTLTSFSYTSGSVAPEPASGRGGAVNINAPTSGTVFIDGADQAVSITANGPVSIRGGSATSSTVVAGSGGLSYTDVTPSIGSTSTIVAGDGANIIKTVQNASAAYPNGIGGNYNINTGSGNDTIGVFNGNATVNAGTGSNLVVLGGGTAAGNSLVYSEGADSIVGNILNTGGNDTVNIGSGATTINPGSSNFLIQDASSNTLYLLAGVGNDTVSVTGSGGASVASGSGNSSLTLVGTGSITATASAGNVTIDATGTTGAVSIKAGTGNDTLRAGLGSDTLQGSSGNVLMQSGGAGATTFSFTNGQSSGADTITGFKATDILQFNGYGTNPGATSFSNGTGGTVFTLNDGTTITVNGNFSNANIRTT